MGEVAESVKNLLTPQVSRATLWLSWMAWKVSSIMAYKAGSWWEAGLLVGVEGTIGGPGFIEEAPEGPGDVQVGPGVEGV